MNPLKQLQQHGQSPWLDDLQRSLVAGGGLRRLIEDDGIAGVTSNPSILEKAIARGAEYQADMRALRRERLAAQDVYERIVIDDVRGAADALADVYQGSGRRDGYVSLEVSPHLAHDTVGTVTEARRLYQAVGRPNLMIKVPATAAGIPAVRALLGEGINVNVTLLFSLEAYLAAAAAHRAALTDRLDAGMDVDAIASVASFFVSRVDTTVDAQLEQLAKKEPVLSEHLLSLRGKAAVANAQLAYRLYRGFVASQPWQRLARAGAMPQRLLWASTSTKNPAYRDVLYVESLVGANTITTLPMATIEAFREHGIARATLGQDDGSAQALMRDLAAAGVDYAAVTAGLLDEGLRLFARAYDALLAAVSQARAA